MNNLLTSQVLLGNAFVAVNHRGEVVTRRLVGGKFGSVTKYFTIDEAGNLKSNARSTVEEVLDGYEVKTIGVVEFSINGKVAYEVDDIAKFEKGDILVAVVDGETVYRQLVGGKQFETKAWFTIDPATGKRTSKTTYENLTEVVEAYDNIIMVLK